MIILKKNVRIKGAEGSDFRSTKIPVVNAIIVQIPKRIVKKIIIVLFSPFLTMFILYHTLFKKSIVKILQFCKFFYGHTPPLVKRGGRFHCIDYQEKHPANIPPLRREYPKRNEKQYNQINAQAYPKW